MRIPSLSEVGRHVDGGVAPHAVDGSDGPWSPASLRRDSATENDAKGRKVSRGAKLTRRRNRDSASDHSSKERRSQQHVNHCVLAEVWIRKLEVTQVRQVDAIERDRGGLNGGRVENRELDDFGEGTVLIFHV